MSTKRTLKADLHVHSFHSGYSTSFPLFRSRDSYSDPDEIYRLAKSRGMDLVTITDHDSIDGCLEFMNRHPEATDFIVGEEIECVLPDGDVTVHVGALGIDERIHREIQPLRDNAYDVAGVSKPRGRPVLFEPSVHVLPRPGRADALRQCGGEAFPAMEARNGTMLSAPERAGREDPRRHQPPRKLSRSLRRERCPHLETRRHHLHRSAGVLA